MQTEQSAMSEPTPHSQAMDKDWADMVACMPALQLMDKDAVETFQAVFLMGWMKGNLSGILEGMKTMSEMLRPEVEN